jgi:hypothetical protein
MKNVVYILILSVLLFSACNNDDPASRIKKENLEKAKQKRAELNKFPVMEFETKEIDFGTHNEGDILDTVFKFKNTGEAPLVITNVKTSCGCTTPYWPKEPIQPGQTEQIKVRFNTNHKPGKQTKTITIHANTKNLTERVVIKAYNIPKTKKGKEKLKKVNKILNNKIKPEDLGIK